MFTFIFHGLQSIYLIYQGLHFPMIFACFEEIVQRQSRTSQIVSFKSLSQLMSRHQFSIFPSGARRDVNRELKRKNSVRITFSINSQCIDDFQNKPLLIGYHLELTGRGFHLTQKSSFFYKGQFQDFEFFISLRFEFLITFYKKA